MFGQMKHRVLEEQLIYPIKVDTTNKMEKKPSVNLTAYKLLMPKSPLAFH